MFSARQNFPIFGGFCNKKNWGHRQSRVAHFGGTGLWTEISKSIDGVKHLLFSVSVLVLSLRLKHFMSRSCPWDSEMLRLCLNVPNLVTVLTSIVFNPSLVIETQTFLVSSLRLRNILFWSWWFKSGLADPCLRKAKVGVTPKKFKFFYEIFSEHLYLKSQAHFSQQFLNTKGEKVWSKAFMGGKGFKKPPTRVQIVLTSPLPGKQH